MTVGDFLHRTTMRLSGAGIETARLDTLIMLEDVLGSDRSLLLAHPERQLTRPQSHLLNTKCIQREAHIPLAYIRGHAAFYGREFAVTPAVLVPRPETESMIDLLVDLPPIDTQWHIADIGTGSGCIGISAALEQPNSTVRLYDISTAALDIARQNADALGAKVDCIQQDLLGNIVARPHIVLANLPYVPLRHSINQAAAKEPRIALFSGSDGLDHYRIFWQQITQLTPLPLHIFTESLPEQHPALISLAAGAGFIHKQTRGLIQHFAS